MNVLVRNCQYLNNIVEQDHRAIKGRCRPTLGFKSYRTAAVTLAGIQVPVRDHRGLAPVLRSAAPPSASCRCWRCCRGPTMVAHAEIFSPCGRLSMQGWRDPNTK